MEDFIPAHQSAFAQCVPMEVAHDMEIDAVLEMSVLLEWMRSREREPGPALPEVKTHLAAELAV